MSAPMFIPWFRFDAIPIPLPFEAPVIGDTLPIQPFGVLVAIGVLLGARISEELAFRRGIAPRIIADYFVHVIVTAFIVCYVLNGIFYHPDVVMEILEDPTLLFQRWLGLSSFGGFIGAGLGAFLWTRRRGLPLLPIADIGAFAFPFGWLFGRTGCFVVHDHPGRVSDFFLAVADYHVGSPPYQPRHDLGLYEVFWSLAVCALFLVLVRRKPPTGLFLALLPLLYAPIRFFLDFLRAEPELGGDVRYGGLTPGQYSAIGLLLVAAWTLRYVLTREETPIPEAMRVEPEAPPKGTDGAAGPGGANAPSAPPEPPPTQV